MAHAGLGHEIVKRLTQARAIDIGIQVTEVGQRDGARLFADDNSQGVTFFAEADGSAVARPQASVGDAQRLVSQRQNATGGGDVFAAHDDGAERAAVTEFAALARQVDGAGEEKVVGVHSVPGIRIAIEAAQIDARCRLPTQIGRASCRERV